MLASDAGLSDLQVGVRNTLDVKYTLWFVEGCALLWGNISRHTHPFDRDCPTKNTAFPDCERRPGRRLDVPGR